MRTLAGLGLLGLAGAVSAQSFTLATFADPTLDATTPMITFLSSNTNPLNLSGTLSGSWTGSGLTLITPNLPGGPFANARFSLATAGGGAISVSNGAVSAGVVTFRNSANAVLFSINFQSAVYNNSGVGGNFLINSGISFTNGLLNVSNFTNGAFGFAFANPTTSGNQITYTASFTSSAVPEPASLAALGLGAIALIKRRRR